MLNSKLTKASLEILEARIAPAALLPSESSSFVKATLGAPVEVKAGQVLNTTGSPNDGSYLLYVEKGSAFVFFTDFNNNREVDFNEITGIAAGDGLRMICFTDIHGDIVTNLQETTANFPGPNGTVSTRTIRTLSDSDSNPSNDSIATRGDGRVLLNNTIEKIEMRSLRLTDIVDQNGDGVVDDTDVALRKAPSTYSIFGNIYAGKGFGAPDGGLIIDSTGGTNFGFDFVPQIGSIKTGTAASGEFFSFGASRLDDTSGTIVRFTPQQGQAGADIIGVKAADSSMKFLIDGLYAGDGGLGARGGNIQNVILNGDDSGGYEIVAGNGGGGLSGGVGGSILNFSDLGSSTSRVVIKSGDGGTGSTGVGGAGGSFEFQTFNIRGDVIVELGDGGNGFSGGGKGAGLAKGTFTQPNFTDFLSGNGYGTTHAPSTYSPDSTTGGYVARFGTHEVIDFDNDGNGDFVYTTRDTSQLVVMFGDGLGGFRSTLGPDGLPTPDRIYLAGVRNAEALTVGDFNSDGHPDIAVASLDEGAQAGIAVFISKYGHTGPDAKDFQGFETARYSALPQLRAGDPLTTNAILPYKDTPVQVSSITAGDFDGNGVVDLAVIATYYHPNDVKNQVLLFLTGDTEVDNITGQTVATGQFYADFGTKGTQTGNINEPPVPRTPFVELGHDLDARNIVVEATALSSTATHDVLLVGFVGDGNRGNVIHTYEYVNADQATPREIGSFRLGFVDTNRQLVTATQDNRAQSRLIVQDFTTLDYDGDGNVDVVALGASPQGFVVSSKGDGLGSGVQDSGGDDVLNGVTDNTVGNLKDNAGTKIDGTSFFAIKSGDIDGDGGFDDVVVLYNKTNNHFATASFTVPPAVTQFTDLGSTELDNQPGSREHFFDPYYATTQAQSPALFMVSDKALDGYLYAGGPFVDPTLQLFQTGLKIVGGDGGHSSNGSGGAGGSLGGGSTLVDIVDPVTGSVTKDLQGSLKFRLSGDVYLFAGSGGDGFSKGGVGGDVTGVTLRYVNDSRGLGASLAAGDGGRGIAGPGGAGGSISKNSIETAGSTNNAILPSFLAYSVLFQGGDGGFGSVGGKGGSVLGNQSVIPDTFARFVEAHGGVGGGGTKKGGDGGEVSHLAAVMEGGGDLGGSIIYTAGNGGNSVAGRGGNGGNVLDNSPVRNGIVNGDVLLRAGDGGSGTTGANGGKVSGFNLLLASESRTPASIFAIAGHGGAGSAGNGGVGGDVSNIQVPSRGLGVTNRILAGNGGASAAAKGGAGGSITDIRSSAIDGSYAVAAGTGGDGLTVGGKGGSVLRADISLGASTLAKALVIAGAGGDATAFIPNQNDDTLHQAENAFGGRIGVGGAGGDINGFTQRGSTGSHVDLIAGNGGSTINYGAFLDQKSYAGRGGSIRNVTTAGDIGNVQADIKNTPQDENVPVKSYNNVFTGETLVSWIEDKLRVDNNVIIGSEVITDADGNVGIVVGAAGRNKAILTANGWETQPATAAQNGSLMNVTTRNLLSAVAGSVDRIASIQLTKGLKILNGTVGADKGSYVDPGIDVGVPPDAFGDNKGNGTVGVADYLLPDGDTPTSTGGPVRDGALVDGALVTKALVDDQGRPTTLLGRVFII